MAPKVDPQELEALVEETARLQEEEEQLLSETEVKQVLTDLNLPVDRLPEAKRIVAEKKAAILAQRKRRRRALAVAGISLGACALVAALLLGREKAFETMVAVRPTLSSSGQPLRGPLPRDPSKEVRLDAFLEKAPLGQQAELTCDWVAPDGSRRGQNKWTTKPIDKDPFPTHCRHTFTPQDPPGSWSVVLRKDERILTRAPFEVE